VGNHVVGAPLRSLREAAAVCAAGCDGRVEVGSPSTVSAAGFAAVRVDVGFGGCAI